MSADILTNLAQLRAILREIHTSGDDTHKMSGSMKFLDQIIQAVQSELNSQEAKNE